MLKDVVGNALQISETRCDDPCILAGKIFSVTSGILAKGILINQKGQKELGMVAKNREPSLWQFKLLMMTRMTMKILGRN